MPEWLMPDQWLIDFLYSYWRWLVGGIIVLAVLQAVRIYLGVRMLRRESGERVMRIMAEDGDDDQDKAGMEEMIQAFLERL